MRRDIFLAAFIAALPMYLPAEPPESVPEVIQKAGLTLDMAQNGNSGRVHRHLNPGRRVPGKGTVRA